MPTDTGAPAIAPLADRLTPAGSVPLSSDQTKAPVPPAAVSAAANGRLDIGSGHAVRRDRYRRRCDDDRTETPATRVASYESVT